MRLKLSLFLILILTVGETGFSKSIDGLYMDDSGLMCMNISGDTLLISMVDPDRIVFDTSPIYSYSSDDFSVRAVCSIKKLEKGFYTINSIDGGPGLQIFKDMSITQEEIPEWQTHTTVTFIIPNTDEEIEFTVKCYGANSYVGTTSDRKCEILLDPTPHNYAPFTFSFRQLHPKESLIGGRLLSPLYYNSIVLNKKFNHKRKNVTITLPNITDETLKQFFILEEIIQVLPSGKIRWRDMEFQKI